MDNLGVFQFDELCGLNIEKNFYTKENENKKQDFSNIKKYQCFDETKNVKGFVVNIHDAANFDIDLEISDEIRDKYKDVICQNYYYHDFSQKILTTFNEEVKKEIFPKKGKAYRCRLKGLGLNHNVNNYAYKSNQMSLEIKKLIDRTDGWIMCTLSDVDIFQRLLVDITVWTQKGPINILDHLISKCYNINDSIFYSYPFKKQRHVPVNT